jgi:hypothetical protein
MAGYMATEQGRSGDRRRKAIRGPVFGWVTSVLGFRRLSRRGETAACDECSLVCMAMNLRRMH